VALDRDRPVHASDRLKIRKVLRVLVALSKLNVEEASTLESSRVIRSIDALSSQPFLEDNLSLQIQTSTLRRKWERISDASAPQLPWEADLEAANEDIIGDVDINKEVDIDAFLSRWLARGGFEGFQHEEIEELLGYRYNRMGSARSKSVHSMRLHDILGASIWDATKTLDRHQIPHDMSLSFFYLFAHADRGVQESICAAWKSRLPDNLGFGRFVAMQLLGRENSGAYPVQQQMARQEGTRQQMHNRHVQALSSLNGQGADDLRAAAQGEGQLPHFMEDYEMQLRFLEQQNQKRLFTLRRETQIQAEAAAAARALQEEQMGYGQGDVVMQDRPAQEPNADMHGEREVSASS
jgi:hypothetical protein